ncbi:MAG: metallophosphoesterase N-terminal domain-containing protein [Bacteroidales bacterium]
MVIVTVTNENGIYYLPSLKKTGFVFISIPGNYEVSTSDNNIPVFFKKLVSSTSVEQKDFHLSRWITVGHVVSAMADCTLPTGMMI